MVHLSSPVLERSGAMSRLTATVRAGAREFPIWYESADAELEPGSEPFLPLALSVAMRLNLPLHVSGAVSRQAVDSALRWQQVQHGYLPELKPVAIAAPGAGDGRESRPPRTAAFFSGGVDSFYTLIERAGDIDALVFVQGFDIRLDDEVLAQSALAAAREVAAGSGKRLIFVRTNLRSLTDAYLGWGEHAFAPALAGAAYLLNAEAGHFLINGEYIGAAPRHASHPDADPLWSTPYFTLESFGDDRKRIEKLERICHHPLLQRHLRVCFSAPGVFNCCHCSKCLRTMACLRALGVLERCTCFPEPLDLESLARLNMTEPWPHLHQGLLVTRRILRRRGGDPALAAALRRSYWRHRIQCGLMTALHPVAYDLLRKLIFR